MLFPKAKNVFLLENTVREKPSKIGLSLGNIDFYKSISC